MLAMLGVVLVGQANEFAAAYLDDGRLFSPLAFALSATVLVLGLRILPRRRLGLPFALLVAALGYTLFIGVLVAAPVTSFDPLWTDASKLIRALTTLTCAFVATQAACRGRCLGRLALVLTAVAAAVVAYQVVSFLLGHQPSIRTELEEDGAYRYSGIFGNPNQSAGFCVLLVCISLLAPLSPIARLLVSILALAGLVSTFSRGGLATFAAVAAANAMIGTARGRIAFCGLLAAAVGFVLFAIPSLATPDTMPPGMANHLLEFHALATGQAGIMDNSRGVLVAKALQAIDERPLAGYGFGRYPQLLGLGAHNMYTHFALLAGIPAALLYAASVVALGWAGFRLRSPEEQRFVVSIAAWMATMGLTSHNLLDEKYSVLLVAMACGVVATRHMPPLASARAQGRSAVRQA